MFTNLCKVDQPLTLKLTLKIAHTKYTVNFMSLILPLIYSRIVTHYCLNGYSIITPRKYKRHVSLVLVISETCINDSMDIFHKTPKSYNSERMSEHI